jgi:sulfur carrier protein ThiS
MIQELNLPANLPIIVIVNGRRAGLDHILKDQDDVNIFRPTGGG